MADDARQALTDLGIFNPYDREEETRGGNPWVKRKKRQKKAREQYWQDALPGS